jgi:hypothetical protein
MFDSRAHGAEWSLPLVQWSDGTPRHTLENPGPNDLIVIGVELKGD